VNLRDWGTAPAGPPDVTIAGTDRDLAAAVVAQPGARIAFRPTGASDLARALGLRATARPASLEVPLDTLSCTGDIEVTAVNAVVLGTHPGRLRSWSPMRGCTVHVDGRERWSGPATTVVVAIGQFLDGADVVGRGHPGDGRAEVQVYAVGRRERAALRRRIATGTHLPHPGILATSGRVVEISGEVQTPVGADGVGAGRARTLRIAVRAGAYSLVV